MTETVDQDRARQESADDPVTPGELAIGVILFGIIAQLVSIVLLFPFGTPVTFAFVEIFFWLGIGWTLTAASGRDPVRYARLRRADGALIAWGLLLGVANYDAAVIPLYRLSAAVFPSWPRHRMEYLLSGETIVDWIFLAIGFFAAPLAEEFCFRGILLQGMLKQFGAPLAIVITAILFSLVHFDGLGFASRFEIGILLGVLFLATKSLWPCIAVHLGNNVSGVALGFAFKDIPADQLDEPRLPTLLVLLSAAAAVLALGALLTRARKTRQDEADIVEAPRRLSKVLLPWAVGALAFLLAAVVFDRRGIQLRWADFTVPARSIQPEKTAVLKQMRVRAHKGQIPVQEYVEYRKSLSAAP